MEVASEGTFDMVGLVSADGRDVCMCDDWCEHHRDFHVGRSESSEE
jgi:hypothetical protein